MPLWERRYIRRQLALASDAQTYSELLPRSGILSGLEIKLAYTNGATGGGGLDVIDAITRIEVIANGSEVLYSLSGIEVAKWAYAAKQRRASQLRDDRPGVVQYVMLPVLFGRRLGDPQLWIDAAAYATLEARITYSATIGVTTFATLTGVLDIIGVYYQRGMVPAGRRGWLRTTQINSFTSAAAGENISIMSLRYPYLDLMVYAFQTAIAEGSSISDVELRVNNSQIIPFTGRWVDIQEMNEEELDIGVEEFFAVLRADNTTIETRSGRIIDADIQLVIDNPAAVAYPMYDIASIAGSRLTTSGVLVAGSAVAGTLDATARAMFVRSRGIGIGHAVYVPFGRGGDLDGVLQAPSFDDLRLALTQSGASSAVRVSTRELVPA